MSPAATGSFRRVAGVAAKGFAAVVVALLLFSLRPGGAGSDYRASGRPLRMPTATLQPVDRAGFDGILVGLRGKPVVVNVWASWCAPCRAEMPLLQRAAMSYEGRVVFLGVASKDDLDPAAAFLRKVGVTYPNVFDVSGAVRRGLGLRGFPTTYVFDAAGRQRAAVVGGVTEARLAAQLDDLLR